MQRLFIFVLFLLPVFLPNTALAAYPMPFDHYQLRGYPNTSASYQDLCQQFEAMKPVRNYSRTCYSGGVTLEWYEVGWNSYSNTIDAYGYCGANKMTWGPNATCEGDPPPPPPPPCEAGCNGACGQLYRLLAQDLPQSGCIDGCIYGYGDGIQTTDGYWGFRVRNNTGNTCNDTPAPTSGNPETPEYKCLSSGQSYGTVNGVVVCTSKTTPNSAPTVTRSDGVKTTSTDAEGNEVVTTSPATETKTGTAADGSPVITTTATSSDGTIVKTESDQRTFCEQNPNSPLCKAEETCLKDPDSPTCKHHCEKYPDSLACQESESFLDQLKTKFFGTLESDLNSAPENGGIITQEVELSFTEVQLPQSMGCPAPAVVSFAGRSVSISYEWLCQYAEMFRPVVIAFAYMGAIMIVFGNFKKEG